MILVPKKVVSRLNSQELWIGTLLRTVLNLFKSVAWFTEQGTIETFSNTCTYSLFQWYAGNVACKVLMFVRAFAFYLSSMTLVCLSLDRCLAIAKPMASLKRTGKVGIKLRGRIMITTAWILSGICAIPQLLVFRVLKHPEWKEFYQCTTMGYFENVFNNNTIMTHQQAQNIHNSFFLVVVYMVPLGVIIATYAAILWKMFKSSKSNTGESVTVRFFFNQN